MFPIGDDNTDRRIFPIVTVVLIVLNAIVFVVFQGLGTNESFTLAYSTVPEEIVTGRDIESKPQIIQTRLPDGSIRQVEYPGLKRTPIPVYLTLLTSMFMHGGIAHILGNMWFLWIFGDNVEEDLGRWRYIAFYLLCGIVASLAHVAVSVGGESARVPSLGASGAISGVMGAYLVLHPRRRVTVILLRMITHVPGFVAVGIWFVFQVISGLDLLGRQTGGVAFGAHIGGFIAGAVLVWVFMMGRPRRPGERGEDSYSSYPSYGNRYR